MTTDRRESGQALVEFSLAFIVFVVMLVGLFDLGRGVYMYNGVSEAAREIARRTVVHPGIVLGASTETQNTVAIQQGLVPELGNPVFACVDVAGSAVAHVPCQSGDYVRVTTNAAFTPISLLGIGGPITLSASASMLVP
jgi:Flp pilus assembly protein TadG